MEWTQYTPKQTLNQMPREVENENRILQHIQSFDATKLLQLQTQKGNLIAQSALHLAKADKLNECKIKLIF